MDIKAYINDIKLRPRTLETDRLISIIESLLPTEEPLYVACRYYHSILGNPFLIHDLTFIEPTDLAKRIADNQVVLKANSKIVDLYRQYKEVSNEDTAREINNAIEEMLSSVDTCNAD